ncbi:MAG: STAS/SEC14 domain-containing protein [Deltaproteobacteria bacterium]|nr:STAS/SEC14 domain-containing protein [Deltaproteobacteria bacterium]
MSAFEGAHVYYSEFNQARAVLVCRIARGGDEENDFGPHIERLTTAAEATFGREPRLALLIIIDPGHPLPNSVWRRRVAEATSNAHFKPFFAVVTDNPLARGMLTALSWLRPQRFEAHVGPSEERAIAWLEAKRSERLPDVKLLLDRVMRREPDRRVAPPKAASG